MVVGSIPYSAKYGASVVRQRASRSTSGSGSVWQKKFTLNGLVVSAAMVVSSAPHAGDVEQRAGKRAEATRVRDRDGERAAL
jgi:hypothetical protein